MNAVQNIFVDIDGVLNEFTIHALRWVGIDVPYDNNAIYRAEWGWGIYKAVEHYCPGRFTETGFWEELTRECWASAPLTPEANLIIDAAVQLVGKDNVCLLSAPPRSADQLAGKLEWIQRHMPTWLHRQYLFGPKKAFCAAPWNLLIDDADHNCRKFRQAGGQAILVPKPWNSAHDLNTHDYMTVRLGELISRAA
jgi:5'(3')-deoxyribonucleotidase